MALPQRDEVIDLLQENSRDKKIYSAVHQAFSIAKNRYPQRAKWIRKSTFRNVVWEETTELLSQLEYVDQSFKPIYHSDTTSYLIDNSVLFRLKHADLSLTTRNVPTAEALAFDDHETDLYGFTGVQRIELCYVLNEFETDLAWVGFSARSHGHHLWKIELGEYGTLVQSIEPDLFEYETDAAKLVRVKPSKETEEKKLRDSHER